MRNAVRPLVLFLALGLLVLSACSDATPPIARGLPNNFAPNAPFFDRRVKERFPIGSDEKNLHAELRSEGFDIREIHDPASRYQLSAVYEGHDLACKESWTIQWSKEQGKITDIVGSHGQACL